MPIQCGVMQISSERFYAATCIYTYLYIAAIEFKGVRRNFLRTRHSALLAERSPFRSPRAGDVLNLGFAAF